MIKLYTKTICPKCILVKRELDNKNIQYELINIEENEEARNKILNSGFMATPILEVDDRLIGDFSEIQRIISELE